MRTVGSRGDGRPWKVGVIDPRERGRCRFAVRPIADAGIATSGDYERFFVEGGVRYHHILDPATGMPANGCQSVTVIAPTAAEADAAATAAFVLGAERGIAFLRARPGMRVLAPLRGRAAGWPPARR